jgi:integrase
MSKPASLPTLTHQKARARGVVRLNGHDHYVCRSGEWPADQKEPPAAARAEYDALIARWLAGGRKPLHQPAVVAPVEEKPKVSVAEVLLAYLEHAQVYYRHPDGRPTTEVKEIRLSLRPLRELFALSPADAFDSLALESLRDHMISKGWCRTLINRRVERVRRCFKWAAKKKLVTAAVCAELSTVEELKRGRSKARESKPVEPVDPAHVAAVLPRLSAHLRAVVELMQLTGMRPGEACRLRLGEVDRTGDVWAYRPALHKTRHRGHSRLVPLGPRARAVLEGFLAGREVGPDEPVFSPRREREERFARWRAARKSKVPPSQQCRRKAAPRRVPAAEYHPHALAAAVRRACERVGVPTWHPHQLRHSFASDVRKRFGAEAAQVLLGHAQLSATELYARKNEALALQVAAAIG